MSEQINEIDIENMLKLLDGFVQSEESRLKVTTSEDLQQGETQKQYHHGRCDIGSPWAKGLAFDVLEEQELGTQPNPIYYLTDDGLCLLGHI